MAMPSMATPMMASPMDAFDSWAMDASEKASYMAYFSQADLDRDSYVSGALRPVASFTPEGVL
jgi:hypothetical protein